MYATRKSSVDSGRRTSQGFVPSNTKAVSYEYKDTSGCGGYILAFILLLVAMGVLYYISTLL